MLREPISISPYNRTNDHERDACPGSTEHQEGTAADFIDEEKCRDGGEGVDDAVDAGCEEACRVAAEAE